MKYFLITVYQLLIYFITGVVPLLVLSLPVWALLGRRRLLKFAIAVDIMVCVLAHGEFRTISGMTGERKDERRYRLQAKAIDLLLLPVDGPDHSVRQHELEQRIAYNYYAFYLK